MGYIEKLLLRNKREDKSLEKMKLFIEKLDERLVNRKAELDRLTDMVKNLNGREK